MVSNSTFSGNQALNDAGGALEVWETKFFGALFNTFANNTSPKEGGAVSVTTNGDGNLVQVVSYQNEYVWSRSYGHAVRREIDIWQ